MNIPKDEGLYAKARQIADETYKKASAYKSGFIVKKYKELYKEKYGTDDAYKGAGKAAGALTRWYKEGWQSVGGDYPTYRPTVRVSPLTPKTVDEISVKRLREQIALKQKIRGKKNLPKF